MDKGEPEKTTGPSGCEAFLPLILNEINNKVTGYCCKKMSLPL